MGFLFKLRENERGVDREVHATAGREAGATGLFAASQRKPVTDYCPLLIVYCSM